MLFPEALRGWPESFVRALVDLESLLATWGFRPAGREYDAAGDGSAEAEFSRNSVRVRLLYDGAERALWIEVAPVRDGVLIGRWRDVETAMSGQVASIEDDLSATRIATLLAAIDAFLQREAVADEGDGRP